MIKKNYFINRTFIFKTTYIPYCSIKVVNQFKNGVTNVFDLRMLLTPSNAQILFINLCGVAVQQLIIVKLKYIF